ncbi:MAG: hypothetical protein ACHQ1D_00745 [Nitrososphaerales archaeon]
MTDYRAGFTDKFKKIARQAGFKIGKIHEMCIPPVGTTFSLDGLVYKIVYKKSNPISFTAEATEIDSAKLKADIKKDKNDRL